MDEQISQVFSELEFELLYYLYMIIYIEILPNIDSKENPTGWNPPGNALVFVDS